MNVMELKAALYLFVREMDQGLDSLFVPILNHEGLTPIQAQLLFEVGRCGRMSVGEVARLSRDNSGNCSTLCKRMERNGFLVRERSRNDERRVELRLTPKGEETLERLHEKINDRCSPALACMKQQEMEDIMVCMDRLISFIRQLNLSVDSQEQGKEART